MKRIFRHLLPFWPQVLGAAVLMTVSAISQLLLPTLMSGVVNEGVYEKDFTVILGYCGQMLAVALVGAVAVILGRKLSAAAVAGFSANLRGAVFGKVMGIPAVSSPFRPCLWAAWCWPTGWMRCWPR